MPGSVQKLLIVDDSPMIHSLYDCLLPEFELVHALDGLDAMSLLTVHPDTALIILDLNMPRRDGVTFLSRKQGSPELRHIPVVLVTSDGGANDVARALERGAAAHISKPFRARHLVDVIYRALRKPSYATFDSQLLLTTKANRSA